MGLRRPVPDGAEIVLWEKTPSPGPERGILSSRTGSPVREPGRGVLPAGVLVILKTRVRFLVLSRKSEIRNPPFGNWAGVFSWGTIFPCSGTGEGAPPWGSPIWEPYRGGLKGSTSSHHFPRWGIGIGLVPEGGIFVLDIHGFDGDDRVCGSLLLLCCLLLLCICVVTLGLAGRWGPPGWGVWLCPTSYPTQPCQVEAGGTTPPGEAWQKACGPSRLHAGRGFILLGLSWQHPCPGMPWSSAWGSGVRPCGVGDSRMLVECLRHTAS